MKRPFILPRAILLLVLLLAASCGTSSRNSLSDASVPTETAVVDGPVMEVFTDDHYGTRLNADAIFNAWAKEGGVRATSKRLLSISPKEDGCHITYNYRARGKGERRVTLVVKRYRTAFNPKKGAWTKNRNTL